MIINREHFKRCRESTGFTLVELLVATSISAFLLASIIGTFLTFAVGARSVGAYSAMSQDSRVALEYFARDMRAAEDVTEAGTNKLSVVFPDTSFYQGNRVTYEFDAAANLLFRIEDDKDGSELSNKVILEGVEQFEFSYFDPLAKSLSVNTPSILLSVKSVQVDAEMVRDVSRTEATDYIISARFMMRNRPVTE